MSKWVSGQQLLNDFGIRDIELFNDYVQKGLQPHNNLAQPISPSDVVEEITNIARLKEQYEELRHTAAEARFKGAGGKKKLSKIMIRPGQDMASNIARKVCRES